MLTKEVSQKFLQSSLISIHKLRVNAIFEATWALTQNAKLTISSLGKHKAGKAYVKHKIKSIDRLVGNSNLHREINIIYKEFYLSLFASLPTISLIVDWSGCCNKDFFMLRASVEYNGRSITIYNEIHPSEKVGNRKVHNQFLSALHKIIPKNKKVTIVTDAGFVTPWFYSVKKLGWDFVGRMKSDIKIQFENTRRWILTKTFYKKAKKKPRFIGKGKISSTSKTPVIGNIYIYKETQKGRKGASKYPDINKRYSKANRTPWVIISSLKITTVDAWAVINKYKNRMQIEQNFRDDKNPRFGFGWREGINRCMNRIAVLCLIAAMASFFLIIFGSQAEKMGLHRRYQVNTSRKRVLSLLTVAKQILFHEEPPLLIKEYRKFLNTLLTTYKRLYLC